MRTVRRLGLTALIALTLAATPMGFSDGFGVPSAHAYATPRPTKQTAPKQFAFTINDMKPGSCLYQGSGWFLCQGPDNRSYACKSTGDCVKLGS